MSVWVFLCLEKRKINEGLKKISHTKFKRFLKTQYQFPRRATSTPSDSRAFQYVWMMVLKSRGQVLCPSECFYVSIIGKSTKVKKDTQNLRVSCVWQTQCHFPRREKPFPRNARAFEDGFKESWAGVLSVWMLLCLEKRKIDEGRKRHSKFTSFFCLEDTISLP